DVLHIGTDGDHLAFDLVTQRVRKLDIPHRQLVAAAKIEIAVMDVHVGMTDARVVHFQQHFRAGGHGRRRFDFLERRAEFDLGTVQAPDKPNDFLLQDGNFSCRSCAPAFTIPADGAAHAIVGNPYFDNVAIKVVDARTIVETESKGAKVVWTYTMRVSSDGQG